jgi:hypothetical protein
MYNLSGSSIPLTTSPEGLRLPAVTSDVVREQVHAILRARNAEVPLGEGIALGGGGLNLDSIALVEVLLECEDRFGVSIAAERLDRPSLTVGLLLERIEALLPA